VYILIGARHAKIETKPVEPIDDGYVAE